MDMFPNRLRGAAMAVPGATNWVVNLVVTASFLVLLRTAGLAGAYAIYTIAALLPLPFVWFSVQETKGKNLEQM